MLIDHLSRNFVEVIMSFLLFLFVFICFKFVIKTSLDGPGYTSERLLRLSKPVLGS